MRWYEEKKLRKKASVSGGIRVGSKHHFRIQKTRSSVETVREKWLEERKGSKQINYLSGGGPFEEKEKKDVEQGEERMIRSDYVRKGEGELGGC